MKLKAIEKICKREKEIVLINDPGGVWLGCGAALYRIYGIDALSVPELRTFWDIGNKAFKDYIVREYDSFPDIFSFEDSTPAEKACDVKKAYIRLGGQTLIPVGVSGGTVFINDSLCDPFFDAREGYLLYERTASDGEIYFAAKNGMFLSAIIMPVKLGADDAKLLKNAVRDIKEE